MATLATAYGFQPVGNYSQATPTGQLAGPYPRIKSGYAYPIYSGDPVTLGNYGVTYAAPNYTITYSPDGYIHSLAEVIIAAATARGGANAVPTLAEAKLIAQNVPVYGFFKGVAYSPPSSVRTISLSSTGTPMWPAGMITKGALDARVQLFNDPASLTKVQTDATGAGPEQIGVCYAATFNWVTNSAGTLLAAPYVQGNDQTGSSKAYLTTFEPIAPSGTKGSRGGFIISDIAPGSEPQEFTVSGVQAVAVPYTSVIVANINTPFRAIGDF
jgi:hypothetical protein